MIGILFFDGVELGYCDQCGRACVPGIFRVVNWHHKFRLCEICLQRLASDVVSDGHSLLEEQLKKGGRA